MITMSAIWDRTAEVLRGRGGMLAGLAALLLFLPGVVQSAFAAFAGPGAGAGAGLRTVGALVGLVIFAFNLLGNLALVAAASEPAIDRPAALSLAGRRLPLAIGLTIVLVVFFALLTLPPLIAVVSRMGVGALAAASAGGARLTVAPPHGLIVGVLAYFMVFAVFGLWASARLSLFWPVVVNERRGMGSFARSFELTRGLTWRIIGVLLLFGILLLVAVSAAQAVAAIVARLLLGAGPAASQFIAAIVVGAVVAGATMVSATFLAQLWRVTSGREAARTFE